MFVLYIFQGQEFTEEFLLEYQREDGGEWMRFRNKRGEEVGILATVPCLCVTWFRYDFPETVKKIIII